MDSPPAVVISRDRHTNTSGAHSGGPSRKPHFIQTVDAKPGQQSSRLHNLDSSDSDDYRDGSPHYPRRRHGPLHPDKHHDRDSGYYGSTSMSAYPSYSPWSSYPHAGYPGYAGPGQMVPASYTAPSQNIASNLTHYHPPTHYRDDRPAITAQEGTVVVRKTRLPGAENKADTAGTSSLNDIDAVWNISSTRDVTLHLELDVEDDIDANLQEFSSFTRRGNYKRAEQYYQEILSRHSEQPKVIVEYVRMLVEKGSYKFVHDLGIDEVQLAVICRSTTSPYVSEAVQLLLLLHAARIRTDADLNALSPAAKIASEYLERLVEEENHQPLNHAQIQVLSLYADMVQHIASRTHIGLRQILSHSLEFALSDRLKSTYTKLLAEGGFWDIRDLIVSSTTLLNLKNTFSAIFPATSTEDALLRLVAEWRMAETDELSDLSLLDILNAIAGERVRSSFIRPFTVNEEDSAWQAASNLARAVASSIRGSNPALMKSRSYLEWLLNEEQRDRTSTQDTGMNLVTAKTVKSFPGKALDLTDTFVYVPRNSENPGWPVSYPNRSNDESTTSQLILVALKAARELGSYNIEARCLHELVCRAEKPDRYLAEMEHIFTSVNGDRLALLKTRLMRYLTVANSDDMARQKLKNQLIELDPKLQSVWCHFSDTVWEWAYRRVLFALMISLGDGDTEQAVVMDQQGQSLAVHLPTWVLMDDGTNSSYSEFLARGQSQAVSDPRYHSRAYEPGPPPPPTAAPPVPGDLSYDVSRERRKREDGEAKGLRRYSRTGTGGNEEIDQSFVRERETERERPERRKSARFDEPEAKTSRSLEPLRLESRDVGLRDGSETKKGPQGLEEERRKQNELIKKRAEELQMERGREREEKARKEGRQEMERICKEKERIALEIKLEQEKLRYNMEREIRAKLEMEERERAERRAMEEQMLARAAAEIKEQIRREEELKAAARAREEMLIQKAKEEAKREMKLKRLAKKEAAAAKRLAKAAIYSEAEANAKRALLAELKARVPGRRLRAMLGIPDYEDSDADGRLIEEVHYSDSSSSVGPYMGRSRMVEYSTESDTGSAGERERRARRDKRRNHRRINQGNWSEPVHPGSASSSDREEVVEASSEVMKGKEKEVVQEEQLETVVDSVGENEPPAQPELTKAAGQVPQSASSPKPTPPQAPEPPPAAAAAAAAKTKDVDKRAKVADESEEEAEEHGAAGDAKEEMTPTNVQEKQDSSDDDESLFDGPADEIDMDNIYD